jgi:hypothetical protein
MIEFGLASSRDRTNNCALAQDLRVDLSEATCNFVKGSIALDLFDC